MTVFYPDISSYEEGLRIQPGTVAVVAKATEGTYYVDKFYDDFKAQSANVGAIFSGYHFLVTGSSAAAQAQAYWDKAGSTPCMLDVETTGSSEPSVDLVVAFMEALKGLGGRVWGVYFPQWYWGQVGGDLSRVTALGAVIVASSYRAYDDNAWPGSYGGATPAVWQYTNAQSYGGQSVDFNAFKGTAAQLAAIINGDDVNLSDPVTLPPFAMQTFPDYGFQGPITVGDLLTWTAVRVSHLVNQVQHLTDVVNTLQAGSGASPKAVAAETLAELKAKL